MIIDSVAALHETPTSTRARRRRTRIALALGAAAATCALLIGVGAVQTQDPAALMPPVAIASLADDDRAAVQGEVAEIFGNKFVLTDPTGRALIETGRAGEGGDLVGVGETVLVQGHVHHGFMHAEVVVRGDGSVLALHPPHPPHPPASTRLTAGRTP